MAEINDLTAAPRAVSTPPLVVVPNKSLPVETVATDEVVLTTPTALARESALEKRQAQTELTIAASEERQASSEEMKADSAKRDAANKGSEAFRAERDAQDSEDEANRADATCRQADAKAQETRAQADAREIEAAIKKQEADLLQIRGEAILSSGEVANFDEGVFLLNLADSGLRTAESMQDEVVHLKANLQASLDLAEGARQRAGNFRAQAKTQKANGDQARTSQHEGVELSGRALQAAEALKLDAEGRREVAQQLLAEAAVDAELAELGQRVQGGFLVR